MKENKTKKTTTNNDRILLDIKRGERLRDCLGSISQKEFVDKLCDFLNEDERRKELYKAERFQFNSTNYISMLLNGKRSIDWNKAKLFADTLNDKFNKHIDPAYIMCESPMVRQANTIIPKLRDFEPLLLCHRLFIQFLMEAGHNIIFHVVDLYDGKQPIDDDWNSLQIEASIDDLKGFSLTSPYCELHTSYNENDKTISYVVIQAVSVDGHKMPYSYFRFTFTRLLDYIHYTLDSLDEFYVDYDSCSFMDKRIQKDIMDLRKTKGGVLPNGLTFEDVYDDLIRLDEQGNKVLDFKTMTKEQQDLFYDAMHLDIVNKNFDFAYKQQ